MEQEEHRRQRRRVTEAAEEPRSVHDVPDDLLRLILLRLDSPLWLVRAACACRRWRRAVADGGRAFLRLAGSLHPPSVFGHYHVGSFRRTAFVPSPPIDGARFSLDFLPDIEDWGVVDCHGGLVLLCELGGVFSPNFIVCDPLTRRYQGIHHPLEKQLDYVFSCSASAFLLDGEDGGISISNFRVLHRYRKSFGTYKSFVFVSTADGAGWRFLRPSTVDADAYGEHVAGRVDGSVYLGLATGKVKVLDDASLEFSDVDLPIRIYRHLPRGSAFTVVHGAGPNPSSPPTAWIIHVHGEALEFFRRVDRGGGAWVLEHSIPKLSEATWRLPGSRKAGWSAVEVVAGGTGVAVVSARDGGNKRWLFSVDMATKKLQLVPKDQIKTYHRTTRTFTYTLPWPRSVFAVAGLP